MKTILNKLIQPESLIILLLLALNFVTIKISEQWLHQQEIKLEQAHHYIQLLEYNLEENYNCPFSDTIEESQEYYDYYYE